MDEVRKMALVPANYMAQLQQQPAGIVNPSPQMSIGRQLSRLDAEMKRILDDENVPDDLKYKLYSHALSQFSELREEMKKPIRMEIESEKKTEQPQVAGFLLANSGDFPADKKNVARKLATFLEQTDSIQWGSKGELVVDGIAVQGSNIHDLFDYVTRNRSVAAPPIGFRRFTDALDAANVPKSIIGNKNLKKLEKSVQQGHGYKRRVKRKVPIKSKRKKSVIRFESLYK